MSEQSKNPSEEFKRYLEEHEGEPFSEDTMRAVIKDDMKEEEENSRKREAWDRTYNAKSIDLRNPITKTEDQEPEKE